MLSSLDRLFQSHEATLLPFFSVDVGEFPVRVDSDNYDNEPAHDELRCEDNTALQVALQFFEYWDPSQTSVERCQDVDPIATMIILFAEEEKLK